jgi:hypothetical protein
MVRRALIRLLGGDLRAPDHERLQAAIVALSARVEVLEGEMHPTRLLEWRELAEQLQRYLKRISAVEGRAAAREGKGAVAADPASVAVLRAKYPKLFAEGG